MNLSTCFVVSLTCLWQATKVIHQLTGTQILSSTALLHAAVQIPWKHLLSFSDLVGTEFAKCREVMENETVSSLPSVGAAGIAIAQMTSGEVI